MNKNTSLWSVRGFPCGSDGKESACNARYLGWIHALGRSPGEGNGSPLQYSCLENLMGRGAWWATVHGVFSLAPHYLCSVCEYQVPVLFSWLWARCLSFWNMCHIPPTTVLLYLLGDSFILFPVEHLHMMHHLLMDCFNWLLSLDQVPAWNHVFLLHSA